MNVPPGSRNPPLPIILVLVVFLSSFVAHSAYSEPPKNYDSGKAVAKKLWWKIGPCSFYCHCPYRLATSEEKKIRSGNLWVIGFPCGYVPKNVKNKDGNLNARAFRVEFEHVVPAAMLKKGFNCVDLDRERCREKSVGFNFAEGDLHNLVPVIGELNGDRRDKEYGMIPGEPRKYGACDFEATSSKAEPTESIRGDVARISLYMATKYGLDLPDSYIQLMKDWDASDPVDDLERLRHSIIAEEMGWVNPYVDKE